MSISPASIPHLASTVVSVVAFVTGCAASTPAPPSVEPTAATRPKVPDGWSTIMSDEGDVRLVVPPDSAVLLTAGSVLTQATFRDGAVPWEAWVTGPAAIIDEPHAGQPITEWLGESGWMPQASDGFVQGPTTQRETILPAGRALEVTTSLQPGTPDEGKAIIYVIETDGGIAILRFAGTPASLDEHALHIQLMSQLVEFGDQPEQSNP